MEIWATFSYFVLSYVYRIANLLRFFIASLVMRTFYPTIVCILLLSSCYSSHQEERTDVKGKPKTPPIAQAKNAQDGEKSYVASEKKDKTLKEANKKRAEDIFSPVQHLVAKLGKNAKIEFAELDKEVVRQDTLVRTKHGDYKISYSTACLNDSLVALEMFNYEQGYSKSYRLQHNYQTNINMLHNGKPSGSRVIEKDIFKNKMEAAFLEKAIIKHPQFVRFDEEKNEAIFQFLVGVPATDWVVLAGVNLSPQGDIRIIKVDMPKYD